MRELARHPELGRVRKFRAEATFYRATETELFVERVMHGTRDLPRRLQEQAGSE